MGITPARPDVGANRPGSRARPSKLTLVWISVMAVVGFVGVQVIVNVRDTSGATPPTSMFIATGLFMSVASLITVTMAARHSGVAVRAALTLGGAMATIAFAKFCLGPNAFARALPTTSIQDMMGIGGSGVVLAIAVVVGLLYTGVVLLVAAWRRPPNARSPRYSTGAALVTCAVLGIVLGAVVTDAPAAYLGFALTGAEAGLLALLLLAAAALVAASFADTAAQARALGTASVYLTIVWIAIAFLLVFQILWLVFLLAIITIWPLRTVTPK